ncbi:serine/threonine-protein kinase [Scytonema sp. NUACC21]
MLINNYYQLIKPLRQLSPEHSTEIFEVSDRGKIKVLKSLKKNRLKLIELFQQEAYILTHLRHPGIPKAEPNEFFTFVSSNGRELHCLVMERVRGHNLEQLLYESDSEPISQDLAIDWLRQIAEILLYLHQNGLFHRDIKPSNIIQKPNGQLVLIDFGTAREITETVMNGKTVTVVYSHGYTAPEQFEGRAIPQSDFFSLGRTLVHLLTGQHPTTLDRDLQTGELIWHDKAPHISEALADFIDELMSPSLAMRPQNPKEILRRIEQIMLHITLQRLKKIEFLPPQSFSQVEKSENSELRNPVISRTETSTRWILSPEDYERLEVILMEFIGPIAPVFLEQLGEQVHSAKELVENVLLFLPPQKRFEFKKKVTFLLQEETAKPSPTPPSLLNGKNPVVTESFVQLCQQELTDLIGPIAAFIVQDTLESCPQISPQELVKALAAEIPDPQKADEFQRRLAIE